MLDKIKSMKGALYRRVTEKKDVPENKTRAGSVLENLRKNGPQIPKFRILPTKALLILPSQTDIRNVIYPVIAPYAYINIKRDERENALVYCVVEPKLNDKESMILDKLKEGLVQILDVSFDDVRHKEKTIEFLETNIQHLLNEYGFELNEKEYVKIMYFIYRDFVGLNKIEPIMNDPYVEDIGCDGLNTPVYVVHQKFGSLKTNIIYTKEQELREFVIKLAERCGRYISYAEPLLDGTLRDGSRVQSSLAQDVTTRGPTFSIRKFKETPFNTVDMIRLGTADPEMLAYLWYVVENGSNILITGGVSTGKTSMLNTISLFIPAEAKIVSIEDTREINLPHENWIPGVARSGFTGTGVGEITMFELLRESFRQNPDYLIVGEVRGKEAYVMFQGMASGHPSIATIHAGSIDDVVSRLRTRPINLSPGLLESLDLVIVMVHARERGKSARRIKEIVEVDGFDQEKNELKTSRVFSWLPAKDEYKYGSNSLLLSKISREKGVPMNKIAGDIESRKKVIAWLYKSNVSSTAEIVRYINMYRRNPEEMERILSGTPEQQ